MFFLVRNCLVGENNNVKIADFGLARDVRSDRMGDKHSLVSLASTPPLLLRIGAAL